MTKETIAEVRNALQIIRGYAELTRETSPDGKAIHGASVTIATVDRIAKILEADDAHNSQE